MHHYFIIKKILFTMQKCLADTWFAGAWGAPTAPQKATFRKPGRAPVFFFKVEHWLSSPGRQKAIIKGTLPGPPSRGATAPTERRRRRRRRRSGGEIGLKSGGGGREGGKVLHKPEVGGYTLAHNSVFQFSFFFPFSLFRRLPLLLAQEEKEDEDGGEERVSQARTRRGEGGIGWLDFPKVEQDRVAT